MAKNITRVASGMNETATDGLFMFEFLFIKYYFGGKYTQNITILAENIEKQTPQMCDIWLVFRIFAYNMRYLWYVYRS